MNPEEENGTVNSSERRHRLNPVEVDPVKEAVELRLKQLVQKEEDLLTASILLRVYYRLMEHVTNRPSYPPHDTWTEISSYLSYGTVFEEKGPEDLIPGGVGGDLPSDAVKKSFTKGGQA